MPQPGDFVGSALAIGLFRLAIYFNRRDYTADQWISPCKATWLRDITSRDPDLAEAAASENPNCYFCCNGFKEPIQLSCRHIFCRKCILREYSPDNSEMRCPRCNWKLFWFANPLRPIEDDPEVLDSCLAFMLVLFLTTSGLAQALATDRLTLMMAMLPFAVASIVMVLWPNWPSSGHRHSPELRYCWRQLAKIPDLYLFLPRRICGKERIANTLLGRPSEHSTESEAGSCPVLIATGIITEIIMWLKSGLRGDNVDE